MATGGGAGAAEPAINLCPFGIRAEHMVGLAGGARIGQIGGNTFGEFFEGIIDEAQIFDHALTDAEILAIYQAGATGQCKPEIFVSSIDPSYTVSPSRARLPT